MIFCKDRVKELEEKELHHSSENWFIERSRLKDIIDEKNQQLEKMKRDADTHRDHIDSIRREVGLIFKKKSLL
jgi:transposase